MGMSLDAVPQTLEALEDWLYRHSSDTFEAGSCGQCVLAKYFSDHVGEEVHVTTQDAFRVGSRSPGIMLSAELLLVRVLFDKRWRNASATGNEILNRIMSDAQLIRTAFWIEAAEAQHGK